MLKDKVILITGSTTGIGEAVARQCAASGARVILHGRDAEKGRRLKEELGAAAALHIDDLSDPAAPQRLVESAVENFGRIDGIVNNAAWTGRSNIENTDAAVFDRAMAVNVRAPLLLIRSALPHLKKARGSVVNIGSINAHTGEAELLAYSISKGALVTLSRNLADALGREGVRVNHLNVGWTLTPNEYDQKKRDGLPGNWPEKLPTWQIPSGAMTRPEEVARHVVFWLSDESRPISGSVTDLEQFPVIGRNPAKECD